MKKSCSKTLFTVLFFTTILFCNRAWAQDEENSDSKNMVKLNVTSLFIKNIAFNYERAVGKRISVGLNLSITPKSTLPFKNKIKDIIDDEEVSKQIDGLKLGSFAISPEMRFYVGKKGVFKGFYLAPYVRLASLSADVPFMYDYDHPIDGPTEKKIDLSGNVTSITGGLMLGSQFKLSKQFYLDWWIVGAGFGSLSGKVDGKTSLTPDEQQALRDEINNTDEEGNYISSSSVDANGARINLSGNSYSIKGLGLSIAYRF